MINYFYTPHFLFTGAIGETPETSTTSSTKQDVKNNSDNLINFSTQNVDGRSFISCKVCGYQIDITDKTDTFVVKCLKCNEATVSDHIL